MSNVASHSGNHIDIFCILGPVVGHCKLHVCCFRGERDYLDYPDVVGCKVMNN